MNLNEVIKKRRSIRQFKSKKVHWEKILEAIDTSSKISLAGNINNLKFIIIEKQKTKNELAKNCQQYWIADAPIIIAVCSDETKLERMYHERGKIYSRQQVGAAIQNLILKLTELGLSTCWVGAYADELIKQILEIPEYINLEAILPIGYPKGKTKLIKKTPLENLLNWGKWGEKKKPTNKKPEPATW